VTRRDEGSTVPLILGFFLLGLMMVAGSLAAGDAFVKQRDLQSLCDGAAVAAAGSAVDLDRTTGVTSGGALKFAGVDTAVNAYLARDPSREGVQVAAALSPDGRTLTLHCTDTATIAFGSFFGKGDGIAQHATSAARAPVR
jgi:hypothetical protein